MLDDWTDSLDRGIGIDAIYLDFQKAFDEVPPKQLMGKINSYGMAGELEDWVGAFLSDRN